MHFIIRLFPYIYFIFLLHQERKIELLEKQSIFIGAPCVMDMLLCVSTVDALPWVQLMADRLKHWQRHDIEVTRSTALATIFVEVCCLLI